MATVQKSGQFITDLCRQVFEEYWANGVRSSFVNFVPSDDVTMDDVLEWIEAFNAPLTFVDPHGNQPDTVTTFRECVERLDAALNMGAYRRHFVDAIAERGDYITVDCLAQVATWGDAIYG